MTEFIYNTPLGAILIIVLLVMAAIAAWGAVRNSPTQRVPQMAPEPKDNYPTATPIAPEAAAPKGPCADQEAEIKLLRRENERLRESSGKQFRDAPQRIDEDDKESRAKRAFRLSAFDQQWPKYRRKDSEMANLIFGEARKAEPEIKRVQPIWEEFLAWHTDQSGQPADSNALWVEMTKFAQHASSTAKAKQEAEKKASTVTVEKVMEALQKFGNVSGCKTTAKDLRALVRDDERYQPLLMKLSVDAGPSTVPLELVSFYQKGLQATDPTADIGMADLLALVKEADQRLQKDETQPT